jgi:tetratricopeptide (TPR) repeat protein
MTASPQILALALNAYRSGNPAEAARIYRQAVAEEPENPDIWCLLGVARRAMGDVEGAGHAYREALRLRPGFVEARVNLGNILFYQGQAAEAEACYREVLRLRPSYAEAQNNLGAALRSQNRLAEAVGCYEEAARLKPGYGEAHENLGDVLGQLGRLDEAVAACRQALRVNPNSPGAHNNLGVVLGRQEKWDEAIAHYQQVLRLRPDHVDAQINLGNALLGKKQYAEAEVCYRRALSLEPQSAKGRYNLGIALAEQGRYVEAEASYREAVRLKADYADALSNLGNVLMEQGRVEEAADFYQSALKLRPDDADFCEISAQAQVLQGRLEAGVAGFDKAIGLRPGHAETHMGRALALLALGDYPRGFAEYEWRWKTKRFAGFPAYRQPLWDGSPLDGKTILLYAEQGLGDTVQFLRFVPLVKERGGRVIVAGQEPLLPLFSTCPWIDKIVPQGETLPEFDVHAPLLSLPRILGTTLATLPTQVPYLSADPELVQRWHKELAAYPGFRIGIAWQGNPENPADRHRSFPLASLEPLAGMPGVQFVSLQKGAGVEQLQDLAGRFPVTEAGSRLDDFMDTAAVLANLDLVITCDTAVAHLAGALAVPVWIALKFAPEWRWLYNREDSPWYPTARLFRQPRPGDWTGVFDRMRAALQERPAIASRTTEATPRKLIQDPSVATGKNAHPTTLVGRAFLPDGGSLGFETASKEIVVKVSPGELVDKITILQIKCRKFTDQAKLANVGHELDLLTAIFDRAVRGSAELDRLTDQLRSVNEALWQIEDQIRCCDRQQDFGPHFIEVARSVYQQNDRRAAIKRQINDLLNSEIIEEKGYPGVKSEIQISKSEANSNLEI